MKQQNQVEVVNGGINVHDFVSFAKSIVIIISIII